MKIAINGAGIAGPTLAWWLKHYGHEPVLFEKSHTFRTGGYVIDFWGLGYDIAEKMGILPQIKEKGYLLKELKMLDADGNLLVKNNVEAVRHLVHDRLVSIPRGDLAFSIFQACNDIETHFGTHIVGIENGDTQTKVQLSNGRTDSFDIVVGADGLHSNTRSLIFGEEARFEKPLGYYVSAFYLDHYPKRDELSAVSHTIPNKQVMRVSLRNGQTVFLFICSEAELHSIPKTLKEQKEALHSIFGEMGWETSDILKRMDDLEELYFDRVSQIRMESWTKNRVALIGDAAACASLLAGEGSGLAMTEAYILAGEIHRSKGDIPQAFKDYETQLRPFLIKKQTSALRIAGFFAPKSELTLKLRNLATRLSNNSLFAKLFVGPSLQDDFELPNYESI